MLYLSLFLSFTELFLSILWKEWWQWWCHFLFSTWRRAFTRVVTKTELCIQPWCMSRSLHCAGLLDAACWKWSQFKLNVETNVQCYGTVSASPVCCMLGFQCEVSCLGGLCGCLQSMVIKEMLPSLILQISHYLCLSEFLFVCSGSTPGAVLSVGVEKGKSQILPFFSLSSCAN